MKISIRTRFIIGIVFFFVIILLLSIFSAYYLNRQTVKTSAILNENLVSVVCSRDMAECLTKINNEIATYFVTNKVPDSALIHKEFRLFKKLLQLEINNITETGEDKLSYGIDAGFNTYFNSVEQLIIKPINIARFDDIQKKYDNCYQQLILLSQMNVKAIEKKTGEAKISAKNALIQMSILGTLCFLIAMSFTFSFATYFNERFFQLYNGIKEIGINNYGQRLHFEGKDEFYEISLVFNEMAEKLSENKQKMALTLQSNSEIENKIKDVQDLKTILNKIKSIEEQAEALISKFEDSK